jgi:hypothetical protein
MSKQITITGVKLLSIDISKQQGLINIRVSYGLKDNQDKDLDFKADQIKDADLDATTKNKINNILQSVKNIIEQREEIT